MKNIKHLIYTILLLFFFINIQAQYSNLTDVISSGGGQSYAGNFSNFGVIGETFIDNNVIGGNYNTSIGFLYASKFPIGINDLISNTKILYIFPNPTNDFVKISHNGIYISKVKLFNILGRKVLESEENDCIDISMFPSGLYFIKFYNNNVISTAKVIRN